jgi:hypothetical protein
MWRHLTSARSIIALYWMFFWLLNGGDKFFNYEHFYGEDRDKQFIAYFASIDVPAWLAGVTLNVFGVMETLLGLLFLFIFTHGEKIPQLNRLAFKATMLVWIMFSFGDILFGARDELREHGIYMILTIVSFQYFLFTKEDKMESA